MKVLSLAWALVIVALCSVPGPPSLDASAFGLDKVGHVGMFFVGALLWLRAWPGWDARVLAAGIAFSVGTEVYQGLAWFLGRTPDPLDVVADVVGLMVGYGVARWLRRNREGATA